jgi:hypothetical protein
MIDAPNSFTRYQPKDKTSPEYKGIGAIHTAHHELGHALLHDDEAVHVDHETGAITRHDGDHF